MKLHPTSTSPSVPRGHTSPEQELRRPGCRARHRVQRASPRPYFTRTRIETPMSTAIPATEEIPRGHTSPEQELRLVVAGDLPRAAQHRPRGHTSPEQELRRFHQLLSPGEQEPPRPYFTRTRIETSPRRASPPASASPRGHTSPEQE